MELYVLSRFADLLVVICSHFKVSRSRAEGCFIGFFCWIVMLPSVYHIVNDFSDLPPLIYDGFPGRVVLVI